MSNNVGTIKRYVEQEPQRRASANGEIRRKNGATRVGTLRKTYAEDFPPGVRSDMTLDTLLERRGCRP
jgi:hypothetical protein